MFNIFIGKAENRKIQMSDTNKARLNDLIRSLEGKNIRVTIERESGGISSQVRGYYWGGLIPAWKKEYPKMTYEDIHELLKLEFFAKSIEWKGKRIRIGKTTSGPTCKSHEFIEYISRITEYMATNGMEVPDPEDFKLERDSAKMK